ncbi:MAG: twitching motility protein PilT, partial [Armatimonadia bacterium]
MAKMDINKLLEFGVKQEASDLILKAGQPPIFRIHGDLVRMKTEVVTNAEARETAFPILNKGQIEK